MWPWNETRCSGAASPLLLPLTCALALLGACDSPAGLDAAVPATREKAFLVSPRFADDGRSLLVAHRGGVGLARIELASGTLSAIEPAAPAPAPAAAALPPGRPATAEPGAALPTQDPAQQLGPPADQVVGEVLFASPGHKVVFDEERGVITTEMAGVVRWLAEGAWGVQVSRQGWVTWCTGHLTQAMLHLWDPRAGLRDLGPGAQPVWLPDGTGIVFTRAEWGPDGPTPLAADLFLHEPARDRTVQLTTTPDVAEMQPAVSPQGDRLAFADWRSGQVLVARWRGAPED